MHEGVLGFVIVFLLFLNNNVFALYLLLVTIYGEILFVFLEKLLFTPLKLAVIFNLTTNVSIFSIDPPKVSKYFNSRILKKIGLKIPSIVILTNPSTVIMAIWKKKKSKVPELKDFETLRGSIEKIETLVVKLKIATNYKGVNNNFPRFLRFCFYESLRIIKLASRQSFVFLWLP